MPRTGTLAERLWARASGASDECWEWQGYRRPQGYGEIGAGRRSEGVLRTHRAAWIVTHGPIPPGVDVCHTCDNPPCCNPAHLFLGDRAANMADASRKDRLGSTGTTRAERDALVRAYFAGATSRELGEQHGLHPAYAACLANSYKRRGWL